MIRTCTTSFPSTSPVFLTVTETVKFWFAEIVDGEILRFELYIRHVRNPDTADGNVDTYYANVV